MEGQTRSMRSIQPLITSYFETGISQVYYVETFDVMSNASNDGCEKHERCTSDRVKRVKKKRWVGEEGRAPASAPGSREEIKLVIGCVHTVRVCFFFIHMRSYATFVLFR